MSLNLPDRKFDFDVSPCSYNWFPWLMIYDVCLTFNEIKWHPIIFNSDNTFSLYDSIGNEEGNAVPTNNTIIDVRTAHT